MENTNEKQEFEFSLFSFLKIFKGKLKMLIAIGLISAMLGGTVGALSVVLGKKEYGNLLTFQFPTPEQSGYSTVIPLLESDLFTEKILIGTKQVDFTDANGITNKAKCRAHGFKGVAQCYYRLADLLTEDELHVGKILSADCHLVKTKPMWEKADKKYREEPYYFIDWIE